ncbi:3-phenylpropionic acid transporter [Salinivibrio proteolyticus]|uniref:3-phenylpropionate MFS transporter n=1 Tax=Salinivibrio proteolyticus TaxID=334715 RepID=UPI0009889FD5|nr:3-phenylpropionate MFS transporter [Salinivibrio proteolyticus]OOF22811.1 3-phenylpropionic acid transporter [Salinivibrio proteolyticus]
MSLSHCSPFRWLSEYFGGFFFSYGVYLPFWAVWFDYMGLHAGVIGTLIGLGFATRCVANLVFTPKVQRVESLLPALRGLTLMALLTCALHPVMGANIAWLALVTVLFNLAIGPSVPLSDALANYYARHQIIDYGRTRLWGSIAFIIGSSLTGWLVTEETAAIIPWVAIGGLSACLLLTLRRPTVMPESEHDAAHSKVSMRQLFRDPHIVVFLLIASLLQGSHAAYYSFSAIYWKHAGYSESIVGYLWSLGVVSEVAVFALGARLFGGWSAKALFRLAALGVLVRWGITGSTTALAPVIMVQLLHGITFAAAHLGAMQYIQRECGTRLVAVQAAYNALPMGAVVAALTAASGWVYDFSPAWTFYAMALLALPALLLPLHEPQYQQARKARLQQS